MTGSIRRIESKSGKPTYQVTLELGTFDGKRKRAYKTFSKKSDAEKYLYANKYGETTVPKKYFNEVCDEWLNTAVKRLKDYTQRGYKNNSDKYIKPHFKNKFIEDITFDDLQNFCDKLSGYGLKTSTVHGIMVNVSSILKFALTKKYIKSNPYGKIIYPRAQKFEHDIYSKEEIKALFDCSENTPMETAVRIAAMTGMRRGEILALKWENVDFNKNQIKVNSNLVYVNKKFKYSTTKSYTSDRTVEIPEVLSKYLKSVYDKRSKHIKDISLIKSAPVVVNVYNKAYIPSSFSKDFGNFLAKNNMKHIRFHDLRHSNAHLLLFEYGVDYKVVSEHLGHSRIQTTLDFYAKGTADLRREGLSKLADGVLGDDNLVH